MELIADSLDMLTDALLYGLYGLSLIAIGGTAARKKGVAKASGYVQLTLAVFAFAEVLRRMFGTEHVPDFTTMIVVSIVALGANIVSLVLLQRSRSREAHMRASIIFTNDIIINSGVILAGLLVRWLNSSLPDSVIGAIVFAVVSRGAFCILELGG
jgi:Co/Zn/Cd efflux system component